MTIHPGISHLMAGELESPGVGKRVELMREILARRPMPGPIPEGGAAIRHKWKISYARAVPPKDRDFGINPLTGQSYFSASVFQHEKAIPRLWKIFVGMGCVNDEPAGIQYLTRGDPRGWTMPRGYGPFAKLAKVYGPDYPFVDRPLYEDRDKPFVFLTAPDQTETDLGGFVAVADRLRPPFFRTRAMWERKLFRADVIVSQTPYRADPTSLALRIGGTVPHRWRIHVGKLPSRVQGAGVSSADYVPLARIYLARRPGKPASDQVHVQQLCYWSLHSRSAINQSLLDLAAALAETAALGNLAVIPIGAGGLAVGTGLLAIEAAMTALFVAQLEDLVASISSVEFWNV